MIIALLIWLRTHPLRVANISAKEMVRVSKLADKKNATGWKELDEINKRFEKAKHENSKSAIR